MDFYDDPSETPISPSQGLVQWLIQRAETSALCRPGARDRFPGRQRKQLLARAEHWVAQGHFRLAWLLMALGYAGRS